MKQTELSKKTGISQGRISQIMNNKAPKWWKTMEKIAKVTGIDTLFWVKATPKQKKKALKNIK